MKEIEAESRLRSAELDQLATAERILDKDVGAEDLRKELREPN